MGELAEGNGAVFFKHEWVICQPVCTHAVKYSKKYTHIGRRELCDRNVRTILIN